MTPDETDERCGQPVSEALVGQECRWFGLSQSPRADNEVGVALLNGGQQPWHVFREVGMVGIEENDDVSFRRKVGKGALAGGSVAASCFCHNQGPG